MEFNEKNITYITLIVFLLLFAKHNSAINTSTGGNCINAQVVCKKNCSVNLSKSTIASCEEECYKKAVQCCEESCGKSRDQGNEIRECKAGCKSAMKQ